MALDSIDITVAILVTHLPRSFGHSSFDFIALQEMSSVLGRPLSIETLTAIVNLAEAGVAPNAIAAAIDEIISSDD